MDDNFSPRVKDVIGYSKEEALRLGHDFIGTEHLILGILRDGNGTAYTVLQNFAVDMDYLRKKIEGLTPYNESALMGNEKKNLHLTRQADRDLRMSFLEAKKLRSSSINTGHILLCILRNDVDPTTKNLNKFKIDYHSVKEQFLNFISESTQDNLTSDNLPKAESAFGDESSSEESFKEGNFSNPGNKPAK